MRSKKLNTEQLITLCKAGNQTAQLEIYNRYYKAMFNTALRIVKNRFEAEDIMQDAFLLAFTKLENLKDLKTFGVWLKRIVINNSISHYNKTTRITQVPLEAVFHKIEDQNEITDGNYGLKSIKVQHILNTLKTLKDNYRIVLTLNLIEGYDYEEICDIMKISNSNCRTTISRAKESLRKKLQIIS